MLNTYIAGQIYTKISFETTISQKKVVEKLSEWLSSPDYSQIFVLNGYAGTGKTTLISAFVDVLADMGTKCILLAPTGRAAKVLSRVIPALFTTPQRTPCFAVISSSFALQSARSETSNLINSPSPPFSLIKSILLYTYYMLTIKRNQLKNSRFLFLFLYRGTCKLSYCDT